jgi:hypothetical protein
MLVERSSNARTRSSTTSWWSAPRSRPGFPTRSTSGQNSEALSGVTPSLARRLARRIVARASSDLT